MKSAVTQTRGSQTLVGGEKGGLFGEKKRSYILLRKGTGKTLGNIGSPGDREVFVSYRGGHGGPSGLTDKRMGGGIAG